MRRYFLLSAFSFLTVIIIFSSCHRQGAPRLTNRMDTISYCTGVMLGYNLRKDGFDTINTRLLTRGLVDYVDHHGLVIDEKKAREIMFAYRGEILQKKLLKKFGDIKTEGEKFLAANKKNPGVVTLPSGLQYKILKKGNGPKPGPEDLVMVHYKGTLIDGTVFEEHLTGAPVPFFVNRVIQGWKEALLLMPEGSKWRLYIPWQLGYGTEYNPNSIILPYSALIFDLELVKIKRY